MAEAEKVEKVEKTEKAEKNINDVILEMQEATRPFIEERGKIVPKRKRVSRNEQEEVVSKPLEASEEPAERYEEPEEKQEEPRYTEEETLAMEKGWKPQDKYEGDPKDFRNAKEFLGRSDLYDKLSGQSQTIKKLHESMKMLTEINRKQYEMLNRDRGKAYEQQLELLKQQKKAAIEIGNVDEVEKYEKAISDTQEELSRSKENTVKFEEPKQEAPKEHSQALKSFIERNASWIQDKSEESVRMKRYAVVFENELAAKGIPEEQRLLETEKEVKRMFAHNFENKNRSRAAAVNMTPSENLSIKTIGKKKYTFNDVPSSVKQIVKTMARYGNMTLDDYAQQLYDTGYLKDER